MVALRHIRVGVSILPLLLSLFKNRTVGYCVVVFYVTFCYTYLSTHLSVTESYVVSVGNVSGEGGKKKKIKKKKKAEKMGFLNAIKNNKFSKKKKKVYKKLMDEWRYTTDSTSPPPLAEGLAVVGMIVALLRTRHTKRVKGKKEFEDVKSVLAHFMLPADSLGPSLCSDIRPPKVEGKFNLTGMIRLGTGLHAPTYRGSYSNSIDVTVKCCQFKTAAPFCSEVRCLSIVDSHPNIINLVGVYMKFPKWLVLVYGYAKGEPLHNFCKKQTKVLPLAVQLRIATQIASAVKHMHKVGLIHRDLKSMNVIVDEDNNYSVRIIDFGSAKMMSIPYEDDDVEWWELWSLPPTEVSMTRGVGTFDWMAPELWSSDGIYGKPVDVYSFSMILFELSTLKLPYSSGSIPDQDQLALQESIKRDIINGYRPSIDDVTHVDIANLIEMCWEHDPKKRPSFVQIVEYLDKASSQ